MTITGDHSFYVDKAIVSCPLDAKQPDLMVAYVHNVGNALLINCDARDSLVPFAIVQQAVNLAQQVRDQQWQEKIDALTKKVNDLTTQLATKH